MSWKVQELSWLYPPLSGWTKDRRYGYHQLLGTPCYLSIHCKSKATKNSPPRIVDSSITTKMMASKDFSMEIYLIGKVHQSGDSWMYAYQRIEALKKVGYLWVINPQESLQNTRTTVPKKSRWLHSPGWIKVASKSHKGAFYYAHPATKRTQAHPPKTMSLRTQEFWGKHSFI